MKKIAVVTDSTSGISQQEAKDMGIFVLPMSFDIDGDVYYEGMNLTDKQFFEMQDNDAEIRTSAPSPGEMLTLWEKVLEDWISWCIYL